MATTQRTKSVSRPARRTASGAPPVNLALQGGGSHGAFTWGVLDALLEDGRVPVGAVSGTSAGALNAAVLACGLKRGGPEGARRALRAFWEDIGHCRGAFAPVQAMPLAPFAPLAGFNLDGNPFYEWFNAWTRVLSPYQLNPLNLNSLRDAVARHVTDDELRASPVPVFVTATSVRTGEPRVFTRADLSVDALLASACLPHLFQAVQIDGQPYWDGGYVANPAMWPLYETGLLDIVLVQLDPLVREGTPSTTVEITDRLNEISFNASLVAEMRAIRFVLDLLREGHLDDHRYHRLRLHRIADDAAMAPLTSSSKTNTDPRFLEQLFGLGRDAALRWLDAHAAQVGVATSFDIREVYLAPRLKAKV
jgi:NTE family protein